jgi:hypothetical protein
MAALRMIVAMTTFASLLRFAGQTQPVYLTFLIACSSCGAGYAVEAVVRRARDWWAARTRLPAAASAD